MECIILMIVVAIIGILAAIAIPQYRDYTIRSANNACLAEAKALTNKILVDLNNSIAVTGGVQTGAAKACTSLTVAPASGDCSASGLAPDASVGTDAPP